MSFLNTTAKIEVKAKLPKGATVEQGIAILQDKQLFIGCDPCLQKYELIEKEMADPVLPKDGIKALGPTSLYKVHDVVEHVPKGLWGNNVESKYQMTAVERGLFCRIQSPMGVIMEALWEIHDAEDGGGLELVQQAEIKCSKALMGIVKGQSESGSAKIHANLIDRLKEMIEKSPSDDHAE